MIAQASATNGTAGMAPMIPARMVPADSASSTASGATVAALIALVSNGAVSALIVVGVVILVNQLEGDLLAPVVLGRSLQLHPESAETRSATGRPYVEGCSGAGSCGGGEVDAKGSRNEVTAPRLHDPAHRSRHDVAPPPVGTSRSSTSASVTTDSRVPAPRSTTARWLRVSRIRVRALWTGSVPSSRKAGRIRAANG